MKPSPHLLSLHPSSTLRIPPITKSTLHARHTPRQHPRPFVTNPLTPTTQTFQATRTLPHPASAIYALITDIESYPLFLPYCTTSTITALSPRPHPSTTTAQPTAATLRIAWGPYTETIPSKIFCIPHSTIEAVSGPSATTSLSASDLPHHDADSLRETVENPFFESLVAKWTLHEYPYKPPPPEGATPQQAKASAASRPRTDVGLRIEVRFANAMLAGLSKAAAPTVAGVLVKAFEERARVVLGEGEAGPEEERMGVKGEGPGKAVEGGGSG